MLHDLGWLKRVKLLNTSDIVINPATDEKLNELKSVLQAINGNVDGLELTAENVNLNTDELENKIDQTNVLFTDGKAKVKILGDNDKIIPATAFGLFKVGQEALINGIRWTNELINEDYNISTTALGNWNIVDTFSLQLNTGASITSGIEATSSILHNYISGRGMLLKMSVILGDSGIVGNTREWGLFDDDNGIFIRLNGTQYEFVLRNDGVETVVPSTNWDIPVTPDANGHLWYIQFQWLGVGNFYLYYDEQVVYTHNYLGTAQKVSIENPDLPIRLRNYNSSNSTDVFLKCGCASVSIEGINLIYGIDKNKIAKNIKLTEDGRLLVSSPPPSAPPETTPVKVTEYNSVSVATDNVYLIPNGETLKINRFSAGAELDSVAGNVVELYKDPNGDGSAMEIIDVIFCSGDSDQHDLDEEIIGDGVYSIRMRRRRFSGGSKEIFGRWEGYY